MSQNTSSAVMAQRREPHNSLDDFPTPPWATRALCEWILRSTAWDLGRASVLEPAANRGHMVAPLREYFGSVEAADVHDYGVGFPVRDYLLEGPPATNWVITNPPFRLAEEFALRALFQPAGAAIIVRTAFLESVGRHKRLFSRWPPTNILQFTERVVMHRGRLSEAGSTATAYCWLVWDNARSGGTRFHWIPPCRKRLERPGDYDAPGVAA